ncbi:MULTISPECIES: hypothetical protein [Rhizobium]|uniref:hypothetical protein n=1 Tax=Rhizobium TaxID=379 RepID=UPI00103B8987|nr:MULTISPECIES: hypothetical protein [Rhizobium]MBY3220165.1 hypothetical protein [Rhizobium laguerreae]MBY3378691.1 hypothetical protein [Rhizobium laguerreae]MBY5817467.1 hypothetical protein [Rhizobium leguminosarum]NKK99567.1 hypothetical protein [Rhizobium leguminosarum bv. viciae]NKL78053.1 hypothetical protein [Rhizobium leguminosarum bv. viciae]
MAIMKDVRRIAWSIYWKSTLFGVVVGFVAGAAFGFVFGFIGGVAGVPWDTLSPFLQWGGAVAGLIAGFWVFNFILARTIGKSIGGRQLELADATSLREGH